MINTCTIHDRQPKGIGQFKRIRHTFTEDTIYPKVVIPNVPRLPNHKPQKIAKKSQFEKTRLEVNLQGTQKITKLQRPSPESGPQYAYTDPPGLALPGHARKTFDIPKGERTPPYLVYR